MSDKRNYANNVDNSPTQKDDDVLDILDAVEQFNEPGENPGFESEPAAVSSAATTTKARATVKAKDKEVAAPANSDDGAGSTFIGSTTTLRGDVSVEGDINIHGSIIGNVSASKDINLTGSVEGDVDAVDVNLADSAVLRGKGHASGRITSLINSVHGSVFTKDYEIEGHEAGKLNITCEDGQIVIKHRVGGKKYKFVDADFGELNITVEEDGLRIERRNH